MNVQVLVATMHREDHSLLQKMNIQSDVIVGNQCDRNEIEEFEYRGHRVKWMSLTERGVGLNRNTTLMRADGDVVLFADDDVVYYDDYAQTISRYYEQHPEADVVIFNVKMRRGNGEFYDRVTREGAVSRWNATKYGSYCITARLERIRFANIHFHLMFGGGARFSSGEDTLFLQDCIKKGLRAYSCRDLIGTLEHGASTWFQGYNDKFFHDRGVLYALMNPRLAGLLAVYHCVKHRKKYHDYGVRRALQQMAAGIRYAKKRR